MNRSIKPLALLMILLMTAVSLSVDADRVFGASLDQTDQTDIRTDAGIQDDSDVSVTRVNGRIPVDKNAYHVPAAGKNRKSPSSEELPSPYRSDQKDWAAGISVKNQENSALCWAFSLATAAEYSYAKEMSESGDPFNELSPGHLGYFFYHRPDDPLGNTSGDLNRQNSLTDWILAGSLQVEGMQHMAAWSGLASEDKYKTDILYDHIKNDKWDGYIPYDADIKPLNAYDDHLILQESIFYPDGADEETIKNLIYRYGSVSIGTALDSINNKYLSSDKKSYYKYDDTYLSDLIHAVTIIGWDDDYSASNFKRKPGRDGAWIIQNSWGTADHEKGIYYASYDSKDITGLTDVTALDMQPADTYLYNFQYDGTADCGDSSEPGNEAFFTADGTSAANIYTNTTGGPIDLEAVGFTEYNQGHTDYTIEVYTDLRKNNDPESGTTAVTTKASTDTCGVKTVRLDKPVRIGTGKTFSIVFRFSGETHFGVEKQRSDDFTVEVRRGESFFCAADSKEWKDIAIPEGEEDYGACFRIKGFANVADTEPEPTPDPEAEKKKEQQKQYEDAVKAAEKLKCTIRSAAAKKGRKALIRWKKNSKAGGYQIRYSTSRKFSKNVKNAYAKKAGTVKKTLTKLKKGKKYYVKVRTYRKITNKATGKTKTVYGKWSKVKSFKAKK